MKQLRNISWLLIAITLLSLPACAGGGAVASPTVDTAPIFTQIAATALALQTQTAQFIPTATITPPATSAPEPTNTPLITNTPVPTNPVNTPKATSQASCDNMEGVADVTIPDGYSASPGEVMSKTWRIKNLGPCSWNKKYALAYGYGGEGTNWDASKPAYPSSDIQPGETAEFTVVLKAPSEKGTYGAYFRMMNDKGVYFGNYVWISIKVE
jgi:hypothetical protein